MPATLGSFSVCFGKLMHHPNTRNLPFAYLIADGDKMFLIPGRNITTVGLYRDIKKWPKRDLRALENRKSIVNSLALSFLRGRNSEGQEGSLESLPRGNGRQCIAVSITSTSFLLHRSTRASNTTI